jgi:hypothetical protein
VDPATSVVYSNCARDVKMTMVNGAILYEDGELKRVDEDKLKDRVREERKKLFKRARLA